MSGRKTYQDLLIDPDIPIKIALEYMDRGGSGILLICNKDQRLLAVLTDGDFRRAMLKNVSFDEPCISIATKDPLIGQAPITKRQALRLMERGKPFLVNHLPIVDEYNKIVDLIERRDLTKLRTPEVEAVIMAGGFGTRLRPLTEDIPKPMLPVGGKPLLEVTIEKLKRAGIKNVNVTTHYLPEKITNYFGDGTKHGVQIKYVNEERPLGTAGALGLMETTKTPLLIMNGDILTETDFQSMFEFHTKHEADMTVGVRQYAFQVPYGVIKCDGPFVEEVIEKPVTNFLMNAGIYLMEPHVHAQIKPDVCLDMPDLIRTLVETNYTVVTFPIVEYWLDIGQHTDYEKAQLDIQEGRFSF